MTAARSSTAGAAGLTDRTVKELSDIAQLAVELARRAGADDAEALVRDGSELTAKVRLGEPELVQEADTLYALLTRPDQLTGCITGCIEDSREAAEF